MFELLSSWGTCATPADESPITLRLQGIIAMVTENWNVRYPNSDQHSIDCTQYWSRLLILNWFYVCLMSVHCARILSHDSGQAWQLYCRVKGGLWKGANGLVLVYSSLHEVLFAWLMFELLSSWGTCATPADESPITLRLQGIIAMVTENWNVRYPNSDQLSIDCTQYWSRLLFLKWFYVCLMPVHCARILSHDSGQAWQLYCRVKGGLWKGANGLVLVYSSLHEVLFAWLMFELLSSWGTCATPADESPITLRLQGIIAMVTENWNVRYPNSDQLSIDCTQYWSRLLFLKWFYVCLMPVHCARILSHDSGQAWQLYCRVKGGLWKGANGLVLVYSSLHEVLFAWLMFELLSSWGTCATPADESPITLRLQGIIAMVTENWNVRYPNSDQLSIDCTQYWSRLLILKWFYVCLMPVHCARILSHDSGQAWQLYCRVKGGLWKGANGLVLVVQQSTWSALCLVDVWTS